MQEVTNLILEIENIYILLLSKLPTMFAEFLNFFLLVLLIVLYSIFIWHFYRLLSKKDILQLNLNQYNKYQDAFLVKIVAGFLYLIEYILISPLLIFAGFVCFTILIILMNESLSIASLLLISATIVASIRITAYYKEDLSREIAKFFPFTLLGLSLINPNLFNLDRIFSQVLSIPSLFNQVGNYLLFIIFIEIILRFFRFIFYLFSDEK